MTWGELQVITLQKMFAILGDTIVEDDATSPYLKSMPAAANEALQLLATAGRYLKKPMTIVQPPVPDIDGNLLTPVGGVYRYDLSTLTTDFYNLDINQVFRATNDTYERTGDYMLESESVFILNDQLEGTWTLYYNAYPAYITKDTPQDTELGLHTEVAVLLPLYIASQLYKDDDAGMATQYRNEFEVGRELLIANTRFPNVGKSAFTNDTGWW